MAAFLSPLAAAWSVKWQLGPGGWPTAPGAGLGPGPGPEPGAAGDSWGSLPRRRQAQGGRGCSPPVREADSAPRPSGHLAQPVLLVSHRLLLPHVPFKVFKPEEEIQHNCDLLRDRTRARTKRRAPGHPGTRRLVSGCRTAVGRSSQQSARPRRRAGV